MTGHPAAPEPWSLDLDKRRWAEVPPAPVVKPAEIWLGTPNVILDGGGHTIGWQGWPENKGGPGFVIVRRGALGALKVVQRYPLTSAGWAQAWHALVDLDAAMAEKILSTLGRRAEEDSRLAALRALDAASLSCLRHVIFMGGYCRRAEPIAGDAYDLRFLEDRLSVFPHQREQPLTEFGYADDVQEVEVAGPGRVRKWSSAQQAVLTEAFGLAGALAAAYRDARVKTFVRVQTTDSELFFLHVDLIPEDLRVYLSPALGAIREAQAASAAAEARHENRSARSVVDELLRLAGLVENGLLTRDEFDQLKARLIAGR